MTDSTHKITLELTCYKKLDLDLSSKGFIKIFSIKSHPAGLGYTHNIKVISKKTNIINDISIDFRDNLAQVFCASLLNQGIYARVIGKNNAYQNKYSVEYSFDNDYSDILKNLKGMVREGNSNFRFSRFVKIEKNNLIVKFVGHEVGGSYTPEKKVVPIYIEKLENKLQKNVKFIERLSGGFGSDIYVFSINLKKIFKSKKPAQ